MKTRDAGPGTAVRGRGASWNPQNRFEKLAYVRDEEAPPDDESPNTIYLRDPSRTVIAHNDSPDVGFTYSINPYRGCEHGCIYCYARPTHEYLGFSAGLDFETKIVVKEDAPELLREELLSPKWTPDVIAISGVTDPFQPIERKLEITRRCLAVLAEFRNPTAIITKNHLVTRDIDILSEMAKYDAISVAVSVTTLDANLANIMEPRTTTPQLRLAAIESLAKAGIPTTVMVAPVIPALNDMEIERILEAARTAGVREAGYVLLRLPLEIRDLFREWLIANYPDRHRHVFKLIRDMRGGKDYDSTWGTRMKGAGPYAWMIGRRFEMACEKLGLNVSRTQLTTEHFRKPKPGAEQLSLFGS